MPEFIEKYRKPGFPKITDGESGRRTSIQYVGPYDELDDEKPAKASTWGDFAGIVSSAHLEPLPGTEYGMLKVEVESFTDQATYPEVTAQEVTYERDWEAFSRSLYEHPAFAIGEGGLYELDAFDMVDIKLWEAETDRELQGNYQFMVPNPGSSVKHYLKDLSENAKMFARGLQLGQGNWDDYAPIIRRTTSYANGIPSGADAGLKGGEPEFPGKPDGYEWRKSTDSGVRAGGQSRWDHVEEWLGGTKVLIDRREVFWSPPTST